MCRMNRVRIEACVDVARAPSEVWEFVADHLNDPQWCRKVRAVERAGESRWNVWHKPVPLRPVALLELEHVRADAPSRLVMREEDETSAFEVEYLLEPTATGTCLTQVSSLRWKRLPRLL